MSHAITIRRRGGFARHIAACAALASLLTLAAAPAVSAGLPAAVDGKELPSLAPMLEAVTPAVVNISAVSANKPPPGYFYLPGRGRVTQSSGSGVIVDAAQGYVLTNHHVVRGAESIKVALQDGRSFSAKVLGSDPDTDLAVLRIPAENLKQLALTDSSTLRVGDFVVAIGDPFGLGQAATSGIVSALDRSSLRAAGYQNFIQTDASINPGNSGGALVNLRGELVGINTMIYTPSGGNVGIGFAIPSNLASEVMHQLLEHGQVQRGTLGVDVLDITPGIAQQLRMAPSTTGVVIARVVDGSPADKAGAKARDVVLALDGKPISTRQQFHNAEGLLPVGKKVRMTLRRNGQTLDVTAAIEAEPNEAMHGGSADPRLTGVEFAEMPREQRVRGNDGVIVSNVYPSRGPVAARLQRGDILIGVNQRPISRLADLRELLSGGSGQALLLQMIRGQTKFYLQVAPAR